MVNGDKRIILDDTLVARVEEGNMIVNRFNETYNFEYKPTTELENIEHVMLDFKGKRACLISSDVLNVFNKKVKLKNLEKHTLQRISDKVIKTYLPYLVTIADNENSSILIQTKVDTKNPAVLITAGLVDDMQVILLDIHYERNERRY